jgi:hypothetical protein
MTRFRKPSLTEQEVLDHLEIRLLGTNETDGARFEELMVSHHYLKSNRLVGEQLRYVAEVDGRWVALLSWSAAAYHLKRREEWIGWEEPQRRRRLALVANNARFLILPGVDCPNLASRALALNAARLSADWEAAYGHRILVVESFVDSQLFRGACYKAQGWSLLGETDGYGRCAQDFYTEHERPKQLWMRELEPGAREKLRAAQLEESLRAVEQKVIPLPDVTAGEIRGLVKFCRKVPDWRKRKGLDYPLPGLLAMMVLATLCGVVRGQRDLAAFAHGLSQAKLRSLLCRKGRDGRYQCPKETTFQRVLAAVAPDDIERMLSDWLDECLGRAVAGQDALVAIDGKAQRGSTPHCPDEQKAQLVSAVSLPGGRVLGTVLVEQKSNEIPAARALLSKIGSQTGKLVMLDALHTNQQTLREIVQGTGADYLLPVKDNHEGLKSRVEQAFLNPSPPPPTQETQTPQNPLRPCIPDAFPPRAHLRPSAPVRYRRERRKKSRAARKTQHPLRLNEP